MAKSTWDNTFPASGSSFSSANMRNEFQSLYQGDIAPLRPRAHITQDMGIMIAGSDTESYYRQSYSDGETRVLASGNVTFVAPNYNNRIDVVYSSGTVYTHVSGTEAASPTVPAILSADEDVIPIALVYHQVGETKIVNYEDFAANPSEGYIYRDIRPVIHSSTVDGTQLRNLELVVNTAGELPDTNKGFPVVLTTDVTGILPVANGGTASSSAKNTANGVVVLDANTKLPVVDGSALTGIVVIPVATVLPYAGPTAPTGFLLCNGATISQTTYAAL